MHSLAKNSIYNIINKCQRLVFPLVSSVYVARIILPEGVGRVSSAQNIVSYFVLVAALGIPVYGVKKIAECVGDEQERKKTFSELFLINSVSTIICSLLYVVVVLCFNYFKNRFAISWIAGITLFANIFSFEWFYQGKENYKYLMGRSIVSTVISLALIALFIKEEKDFINYALICSIYTVFPYLIDSSILLKNKTICFESLSLKKHLKPIFTLLASSVAIEIYVLTDITMLNILKGDEAVGFYTNAMKTVAVLRALIAAVCAVFLPRLSLYFITGQKKEFAELAKKGLDILVTLALPAAAGLIIVSNSLIPLLFGEAFTPSSLTSKILSLSVITVTISNFTGYQILTVINKEKQVLISTIIGAVINVFLNIFLIWKYSYNGAAIASVITELIVTIYQIAIVKQYGFSLIRKKNTASAILSTLVMSGFLLFINTFITNNTAQLLIDVITGFIIYCVLCKLTGNKALLVLIEKNNTT